MTNNEIMIYGEIDSEKKLVPVVFELLNVASELAPKADNAKISVFIPYYFNNDYKQIKNDLQKAGCDKVIIVDNENLNRYSTDLWVASAIDIIKEHSPSIVLIGATVQGRDLAPKISTALGTGLTADCTKLDINEKKQLAATRPTFGGNLMATILCKNFPQMATVRPNVFPKSEQVYNKPIELIKKKMDFSNIKKAIELCEVIPLPASTDNNLSCAQIVVAGGKGMKTKEGFELITKLSKLLNGVPAASRGAVDLKIAPQSIQVGQTGKTVTPKIYIACGISGAIQHTVGMNSSDVIIAINSNPNAKIFDIADYSIVGNVFEILPKWIELLESKK